MTLQDQPITTLISRSKNGCKITQESKVFYHIERHDTDLEIMCESGYNKYRRECGIGSVNATLYINTDVVTGDTRKIGFSMCHCDFHVTGYYMKRHFCL
jgi:hypothetical protein